MKLLINVKFCQNFIKLNEFTNISIKGMVNYVKILHKGWLCEEKKRFSF